jgi:hypothetical protein
MGGRLLAFCSTDTIWAVGSLHFVVWAVGCLHSQNVLVVQICCHVTCDHSQKACPVQQ